MRTTIFVFVATLALSAAACSKQPTRWDDAGTAPIAQASAPAEKSGSFNKFFPADGTDGHKLVYTADKEGYAEAKLEKDGKDVATFSIADTRSDAEAKAKFASASDKLGAYPLVTVGKNQSAVLVADRFQVKVSSTTLDADARKNWLQKFNLDGLAKL